MRLPLALLLIALPPLGCDETSGTPADSQPPVDAAPADAGNDALSLDGPAVDGPVGDLAQGDAGACPAVSTRCVDTVNQEVCKVIGGVATWVKEGCPSGTLCLDAACSAECVDQCDLGETRTSGGTQETCSLFSVAKNAVVAPSSGLHDRARQYNAWIRKWHLPGGTIGDVYFTDATHKTVAAYHGTGDSAIWTGTYLAAEAIRLKVTGSPDAEKNVEQLVEAIHRLFQVTGHTGFMARYTAPLSADPLITAQYDPTSPKHHKVTFQGQDWFWSGNTSRDQYQGMLLGYAHAYEALSSTTHRQMIRDDIVALCKELITDRKGMKITIRFNALGQWNELPVSVDMQHIVLNPSEFKNGGPYIQIGNDAAPSDYNDSEMYGFQEFMPDMSKLLKQIPILGALITFPIPRSGSAIMLPSILRIGMLVTDGVAGYSAEHAAFKDHYDKNVSDWLGIMKQFAFLNTCWDKYYGLNIAFEPVYNLVRLEPDPQLRSAFQQDVLEGKMWQIVKEHKNVFFSYIHASQAPNSPAVQAVIQAANAQLAQFPPPPHIHAAVDNTGKYPADPNCPGHSTEATEVKDRTASDFIWQRQPFSLTTAGDPKKVYPGIDFLMPYWMGRFHKFFDDDAKGTCLRWQ